MSACPKCKRQFPEAGFCPFDGSTLIESGPATVNENGGQTQVGEAASHRDSRRSSYGTDDLVTTPHAGESTGEESAVQRVLQDVIDKRGNSLIGAELDGRYKIERQIGEGGMGVVYLAHHMVIEKPVAIKVLRAEVAADDNVVKRFVQEARAASRIGHPNIIDVTDFGTTRDGLTYQVMEYLQGTTLSAFLKEQGTLDLPQALPIIAQMARALGAAHDKGIVHRDLKPENVFLMERDGRKEFVKIVDFGIAKVQSSAENPNEPRLTRVGTVFGTPEYMAPEQAAGRTDVDARADVYALGTILYEMLLGKVPHRGDTTVRTLAMQMLDEPKPFKEVRPEIEVGAEVEAVVMRSLAKKREERYQSVADFLSALESVTSNTELDLPLVLQQERSFTQPPGEGKFDTVPEANPEEADAEPSQAQGPANDIDVHGVAERAAGRETQSRRRAGRATDPAFLRRQRPTSIPYFDESPHEETEPIPTPGKSRAWLLLLAVLLVSGAVGAFVIMSKDELAHKSAMVDAPADAAPPLMAATEHDAQSPQTDAALVIPDAGTKAVAVVDKRKTLARDKPSPPRSEVRKPERPRAAKGEVEVTVVTRPRGAQLFIGQSYAGSDGLNLRRKAGTRLKIGCQLSGFRDGSVKIAFDGKREVFLCRLREFRKGRCVEGMKNPFDDCP